MSTQKKLNKEITERIILLAGENPGGFARSAGIKDQTFRTYLKGAMPSPDKAVAIAQAAGVSVEWLFTGQDCPLNMDGVTPIEAKHIGLVRKFKEKGLAVEINEKLLEIEDLGPGNLLRVHDYLSGLLSGIKTSVSLHDPNKKKAI